MPLAEHDLVYQGLTGEMSVSIHVPLAEHDGIGVVFEMNAKVSIHVPLAEHDRNISYIV